MKEFSIGIDVGSTTVKAVVRSTLAQKTLFCDYRRHESRQAQTVLQMLKRIKTGLGIADENLRLFLTGSGGQPLTELLGARFVQEVAALSLSIEKEHPQVSSVIELGGQDAKMIFFEEYSGQGQRKKIATMNDKCAGGTGVVIEKMAAKLHIPFEELSRDDYADARIYPVAGKCGVFAETDITGLQKEGVSARDLMASLFQAIVLQNLSVLTRGNTPMATVYLLGGPCAFFPGLRLAWRRGLLDLWKRKDIDVSKSTGDARLVVAPPQAEYFAARGAIEFGASEPEDERQFRGTEALEAYLRASGQPGTQTEGNAFFATEDELQDFRRRYSFPAASVPACEQGELQVYLGLDGGSTSTKAVALSGSGDVLASSYRLSQADPISEAVAVLTDLEGKLKALNSEVRVLGFATTGYSKDLLKKVLSADIALVETVAHAKSSQRLYPDVDAIVDVGGQDIKIIVLENGAVKDFRLNTQCSAGNGYFLQSAATAIGIRVEEFADTAFRARRIPQFSYGCAVFLQSDIVNFQRQGWKPEEILAGLATVLPKNVFLYVAGVSNVATLGRRFVLQGGTQRNLAVVKAEIDFIRSHYHGSGEPQIAVHPNCSEAGAIGAALQAIENSRSGCVSSFPGFESLNALQYTIRRDETTRCPYCANHCLRTFVEIQGDSKSSESRHVLLATCERGEAENLEASRKINQAWKNRLALCPNFVEQAAVQAWRPMHPAQARSGVRRKLFASGREGKKRKLRGELQIGIPRALNLYTYAPLFSAYFESLGIPAENLHSSHFSSAERYKEASGFSAVDPCFPSKVAVAHVYELLEYAKDKRLDFIFFPMFDVLSSPLENCQGSNACPSGAATPEAVKAAFSRKVDWFHEAGVQYVNPVLNMADRDLFKYQMFEAWKEILDLDWDENCRAVQIAFDTWTAFEAHFRERARNVLDELERSGRLGLVLLGRPYHHDPGINQGILEELQHLGFPTFTQSLLPLDADLLDRLFGDEVRAGTISSPLDISDVWKHTFSASSNHKIWAAKFAARHPNLIPVELSNFKCGHDAFISRIIGQIIAQSGKPHFAFRDLDENQPLASIRIRIETMHHFLQHYQASLRSGATLTNRSLGERHAEEFTWPNNLRIQHECHPYE